MTPMVDQEEQRLIHDVVEASVGWSLSSNLSPSAEPNVRLLNAVCALGAYRSRSATPTPPRCEPPEHSSDHQHHWLDSERASYPSVAEWIDGAWYCANEVGGVSREEMNRRGWRYLAPCIPPESPARTDGRVEPTDEAIDEFNYARLGDEGIAGETTRDVHRRWIRRALTHFHAPILNISRQPKQPEGFQDE